MQRMTAGLALALIALVMKPAVAAPRAGRGAARSLRWAERLLAKGWRTPPRRHTGWLYAVSSAEEAFEGIIVKYGGSARAYDGLGQSQVRQGEYGASVGSFQQALRYAPSDERAKRSLQSAQARLRVASDVGAHLPRGQRVLQVQPLGGALPRNRWAVLTAHQSSERGIFGPRWHTPRLILIQSEPIGYRTLWQSGELRDPRFESTDWDQVALDLFDYTGDGKPEVAVWKQYIGGSWAPCHLQIYQAQRDRLVKIIGIGSDQDFDVDDLNCDGLYEVSNCYCIGLDFSHVEQPRWEDIYAFDSRTGRYILANRAFPKQFRRWPQMLRTVRHPGDPEILEYLGVTHEIQGDTRAALAAYQAADRAYRRNFADEKWRHHRLLGRMAALRARLRAPDNRPQLSRHRTTLA